MRGQAGRGSGLRLCAPTSGHSEERARRLVGVVSRDARGSSAWVSAWQSCLVGVGALRKNDIRRGATEGAGALKSPKAPRECAHRLGSGRG